MAEEKKSDEKEASEQVQGYLDAISKYDRAFKKWEERNQKILKRYRDEERSSADRNSSKFNILWSNVQTLVPACFSRLPQPDVSRRFRDQDQVGRVASLLMERGLEFEVQHYPDYRETMTQCVNDRFLGGRGTCWVRYEPHFKNSPSVQMGSEAENKDSGQITEDVEDSDPEEQLDYECAPVDYVHWKDFGHSVARTWEEVTLVWRKVYMSEESVKERFGEEVAKKIPYDSSPDEMRRSGRAYENNEKNQACVIELWDKHRRKAVWLSKTMKDILDERDDPLKLQHFFPCPKPLFATLTNDTLVPVPDFSLYQDQANDLDMLADRASGLDAMMQLKGVYDGSADASLARLFTEGSNGNLIPVKNWAAFAEKGGLKGQIDVYDMTPIARARERVTASMGDVKNQVYEIMGISDIIRGQSDPNETLGAQEIKGQYASMRLRAMQQDVSRFATDILQIKAQIMCAKFNPQTLIAISAAEQLSDTDKQMVPEALKLLIGEERMMNPEAESPNPMRAFRIEVSSDSMVQMNESKEKQERIEFLTAIGSFVEKAAPVVAQAPTAGPLLMEMLKFGVTAFKVGKTVEGKFDELIDNMMRAAMQPKQPAPPDPRLEVQKMKMQSEMQVAPIRAQAEMARAQADVITSGNKFREAQVIAMTPPQQPVAQ